MKPATTKNEPAASTALEELRRTALQSAALVALAIALERLVTGRFLGGAGVHPHPYWIIVLPLAASRGVLVGLVSASAASTLYIFSAWLALRPVAIDRLFDRTALAEPVLFFAAAVILGEVRYVLSERLSAAYAENRALHADVARMRAERTTYVAASAELTRRLAHQGSELEELIRIARRMRYASRTGLLAVCAELASEQTGGAVRILAESQEGGPLETVATAGPPASHSIDCARSALVQRCWAQRCVVSAFSERRPHASSEPLVVAPLLDFQRNVVAVLVLEDIAPERLSATVERTLGAIAGWVSAELQDPTRELRASAGTGAGPVAAPQRSALLPAALRFEARRFAAHGVPAQVIALYARSIAGLDETRVARAVAAALGSASGLFRACQPSTYALLLPECEPVAAQAAATALEQRLLGLATGAGDAPRAFTFPIQHGGNVSALLRELSLAFRRASDSALEVEAYPLPEELQWANRREFAQWLERESSRPTSRVGALEAVRLSAGSEATAQSLRLRIEGAARAGRLTDALAFTLAQGNFVLVAVRASDSAGGPGTPLSSIVAEALRGLTDVTLLDLDVTALEDVAR